MAQFDNDQQARGRALTTAEAAAAATNGRITFSRGRAAPDERRREHLSSSSSSCSSCSSSASSSDGAGDDELDGRTGLLLRGGVERIKCERAHYPGRFHREHRTTMQGQQSQTKPRASGDRQQQHCNGELVNAVGPQVGLSDSNNSKSRSSGQLSRQHNDGSAIGAQLMNVLKIKDDLNSSSHARLFTSTNSSNNMLVGHPQELDARLTMSTGVATSGAAIIMNHSNTNYDHDHDHERAILSRGHAAPLVVVSPVAHHQHLHQDLHLVPANAGQEQPHFNDGGQQYVQWPTVEPLRRVPSHGPFYNPHHHHHYHNHLQHATYANQLVADDGASQQHQQLSYADLDEETARHQNERRQCQQQQQTPGESLPESVILANGLLAVGPDWRHHTTTFYSHQHNQSNLQQNYTDPNLTSSVPQTSTTLAALNSSFNGDIEQRAAHRQLGASTGSSSVALKELSSVTADGIGAGGSGRWKGLNYDDTDRLQQQRAELSMASESEQIVVEQTARNSPIELKVCEWRDCGNTFLDMNEFVRHLEEKHVNLEPREKNRFFCLWDNCKRNNQEFNARYKLLIHMRVHSGEKPYFCQNVSCKKSFSRLENLKIHVRSHTGEKPYMCQYEHCSKSFTNSSDRIKHHKTHKDPKPYNCTHNGCTKRYTDPSSLRKHLRAHKRHSFGGSMDSSCELSTIAVVASDQIHHSNASCSFSSTRLASSHGPQTSSAASMSNELHYANQHNRNHHQQAQDQQHQYEPYVETIHTLPQHHQQQQVSGSELEHHQQDPSFLHADYDPSEEFANVLSDPSGTMSEITTTSGQEAETTYYVDSSFERPYQQHAQLTNNNFEATADNETISGSESYCTQQAIQYLTPTQPSATNWNRRNQRPQLAPARMFRDQMDSLRDRHQQLSKSWCGSGYSMQSSRQEQQQQRMPWANTGRPQQQCKPRMVSSQIQTSISPSRTRRRVEFECAPTTSRDYETEANWTGSRTTLNYDQQQQQMDADVHYQNRQQQCEQNWPSQSHAGSATGDNQQRQIHYQAHDQYHHHHQQQQQQPLTRRQQHAQLMRSMPATVNFNQSRGSSFEDS